jgi:hypothetical protein
MKKIFKALVVIVVVIMVLIAIGVGILFSQINNIAKTGIERGGTYALGVPTTLGSIDISVFSGKCDLDNLNIANPSGFTYDNFMKIGHGEFALDTSTIRSEKIVVQKLHFNTVELSIEKTQAGSNYQVILDNLQKTADSLKSGEKTTTEEPADESSETGFVIQDILIENVKVNVNLDALGIGGEVKKTIELKDPIHLTNIGSANDAGAQMSTVIAKLVQTMFAEILRQGGGFLPPIISDELGKGLDGISAIGDIGTQIIGDTVGETLNQVGNVTEGVGKAAEGVTNEAGKAVEGTTKEIGKAADGLLKGVGGLLGGNKEKTEEKSE